MDNPVWKQSCAMSTVSCSGRSALELALLTGKFENELKFQGLRFALFLLMTSG